MQCVPLATEPGISLTIETKFEADLPHCVRNMT